MTLSATTWWVLHDLSRAYYRRAVDRSVPVAKMELYDDQEVRALRRHLPPEAWIQAIVDLKKAGYLGCEPFNSASKTLFHPDCLWRQEASPRGVEQSGEALRLAREDALRRYAHLHARQPAPDHSFDDLVWVNQGT